MSTNVVELVQQGKGKYEWFPVELQAVGHKLEVALLRDALKFDGVPSLTWDLKPVPGDSRVRDGVRLPGTAAQLQQVADLLNAVLLTPKLVDVLYLEAGKGGRRISSVVNVHGVIVANSHILDVHDAIEKAISDAGGDEGGIIDSVGKYWVLANLLLHGQHSNVEVTKGVFVNMQAINYGWPTEVGGNCLGVLKLFRIWQNLADSHNYMHFDPSQTIRLVHRSALLTLPSGSIKTVDITDIMKDPVLWPLVSHEGPLQIVRQPNTPVLEPLEKTTPSLSS